MNGEVRADKALDCRGLLYPMPIIKVSQAIKEIEVGQVLEMLATDPGSKPDMEAWSRQTAHELLKFEEEGGLLMFYIRRKS
jgi:tRNA 2-thiouridine synthesizing protein A